jgi:hypothetical protein
MEAIKMDKSRLMGYFGRREEPVESAEEVRIPDIIDQPVHIEALIYLNMEAIQESMNNELVRSVEALNFSGDQSYRVKEISYEEKDNKRKKMVGIDIGNGTVYSIESKYIKGIDGDQFTKNMFDALG